MSFLPLTWNPDGVEDEGLFPPPPPGETFDEVAAMMSDMLPMLTATEESGCCRRGNIREND